MLRNELFAFVRNIASFNVSVMVLVKGVQLFFLHWCSTTQVVVLGYLLLLLTASGWAWPRWSPGKRTSSPRCLSHATWKVFVLINYLNNLSECSSRCNYETTRPTTLKHYVKTRQKCFIVLQTGLEPHLVKSLVFLRSVITLNSSTHSVCLRKQ